MIGVFWVPPLVAVGWEFTGMPICLFVLHVTSHYPESPHVARQDSWTSFQHGSHVQAFMGPLLESFLLASHWPKLVTRATQKSV